MKNPVIWENSPVLEALEVGLGITLAIFLNWVSVNVPELSAPAGIFNSLLIWAGILYVGKKFKTMETIGWGSSPQNALYAAFAGLFIGIAFSSGFSVFNVAIPQGANILGLSGIIVFVGIVAPLSEETFFRGAILPTLAEYAQRLRIVGVSWYAHFAVIGSSLLFAAFHFLVSNGNPAVLLASFAFGLVAGYGSIYFQSTAFAYVAHLVNNLRAVKAI